VLSPILSYHYFGAAAADVAWIVAKSLELEILADQFRFLQYAYGAWDWIYVQVIVEEYFKSTITLIFAIYGWYDLDNHSVLRSDCFLYFSPTVYFAAIEMIFYLYKAIR
jgi:hypothetical protein